VTRTFYGERAVFDRDFGAKLARIEIEPDRLYHFGTGQASDSLVWGDRHGVLSDLMSFSRAHPNVLLELKTKSSNIAFLLANEIPPNVVCSWSLNPEVVVRNEEIGTPSFSERLTAARRVADRGIRVAFHFHPMVYYKGWEDDYGASGRSLVKLFDPEEVLFVSYGSLTLIKPAISAIRKSGMHTRILQMETARDPKGKVTYPDRIKVRLFRHMHEVMRDWHGCVYTYLCMEKRGIWNEVFGFAYESNEQFEYDLCRKALSKCRRDDNAY
jgi:spore photoproduct lyase